MTTRVLMVLTSHASLGISGKRTGNWFDEVATPYYKFREAGFDVTLASVRGGEAPIDPFSYDDAFMTESTHRFLEDSNAQRALANTLKYSEIDVDDYAGVFFPGGYGQLWDLASDMKVIRSIEKWIDGNTPVAMVCHAPAILRDARKADGAPLVKGLNVTGFTDAEDEELDLARPPAFLAGTGADRQWGQFPAVQCELAAECCRGWQSADRAKPGLGGAAGGPSDRKAWLRGRDGRGAKPCPTGQF